MAEPEADRKQRLWHFFLRQRAWLIPPVLFLLALLPRLSAFWQGFITPDEPFWVYRSMRFLEAIENGQWANTFQIGHPGVTTMWAGTLSILYNRWQNSAATAAHLAWIAPVSQIAPENAELMTHLAPFLPAARAVVAIVDALGVVGIYFLARRLWDEKIALAGAVLIALDPFTIALSGLLHVDALMTTFMVLSLLAWLNALLYPSTSVGRVSNCSNSTYRDHANASESPAGSRYASNTSFEVTRPAQASLLVRSLLALFSALCAGLAILSKSPGVFIVAAVGVSTVLWLLLDKNRSFKTALFIGLPWIVGLVAALFLAFPAMWVDPLGTLVKIYGLAGRYRAEAHEITFFNGISGGDPGPWFYPAAYLLRLMPATLIGLALSFAAPLFDRTERARQRRLVYLVLWLFVPGFALFINLGAKKFDRYLLPTFPVLNLLAAIGWIEAVRWPFSLRRTTVPRLAWAAMLVALLLAQVAAAFTGWPYYLDAYNPLAGGLKAALRTLSVGWGEGLEQVADYLNAQPDAETLVVAGASPVTLGPLFKGQVLTLDDHSRLLADMVLVSALDRQVNSAQIDALIGATAPTGGNEPIYTVRAGGQEIFWLYETRGTAEVNALTPFAAPTDLILCDAPTPFARRGGQSSLGVRVVVIEQADEARIAFMLNQWSSAHTRLWYVASPAASLVTAQALRRQLDTFAASLDEIELDDARITLYILPGDPVFTPLRNTPGRFGAITLQGAALIQPNPPADGKLDFTLYWQAEGVPQDDLTPFIHLVDQAGHLRASERTDAPLLDQRGYPTSAWQDGDGIERPYRLALPPGLPPGRYQVRVGMATPDDVWVPVSDVAGQIAGTTALAFEVDIAPAQTPPQPDELAFILHPSITWRGSLRLFGVIVPDDPIGVGQTVPVALGWRALDRPSERYSIQLSLTDANDQTVLAQIFALSQFPTDQWRRGETLREMYDLRLPADLPGGMYDLSIQVLDADGVALSPPVSLAEIEIAVAAESVP